MSLLKDVIQNIEKRKRRRETGLFNSIPCPFPKLQDYYPGIEKGKYEMITASPKRGKSQLTDYMYVYNPIKFCNETNSDLDYEVHYLSLEMTKQQKLIQAMCHFMFLDSEGKVRVSPEDIRSTKKALESETFELIIKYEKFFEKYLEKVHYYDNYRNVDEIAGFVNNLSKTVDPKSEKITSIILDHASLIIPRRGQSLKQAIDETSASTFVKARNLFRLNPVLVQQQANEKESFEARKMNDLLPSFHGLADSKDTQRDIDIAFGIFSPEMAKLLMYNRIDVNKYKNNLRILNILGGRESTGQQELALYFDGAVSFFKELH